jgi:hypothetical protein
MPGVELQPNGEGVGQHHPLDTRAQQAVETVSQAAQRQVIDVHAFGPPLPPPRGPQPSAVEHHRAAGPQAALFRWQSSQQGRVEQRGDQESSRGQGQWADVIAAQPRRLR